MRVILRRYYGDQYVTKSTMQVFAGNERDQPVMVCEAREPKFKDYASVFPSARQYCLPRGTYRCRYGSTDFSPLSFIVTKAPGHMKVAIGYAVTRQTIAGAVIIGESDGDEDVASREIKNSKATFDKFEALIYEAYARGESLEIVIENKVFETSEE